MNSGTSDGPAIRVLLVEDDENDVLFLKRAFRSQGCPLQIEVATDGEEAKQRLSRSDTPLPDRIILDLKLPRLNGLELLAWIRSTPELRHLSVTVLTSSGEPSDRLRAQELGIDAHLVKPVAYSGILEVAGDLCRRWGLVPAPRKMTG